MFENLPRLNGTATVELTVNGFSIIIELDGNNAPITAGNFVDLVERGVYDGVAFHRVIEGFVAQGGDPQSLDPDFEGTLGTGGFIDPETGNERNIPLEIKLEGDEEPTYSTALGLQKDDTPQDNTIPDVVLEHTRGSISMARETTPDTASSQFYIGLTDEGVSSLDGDYAVFGYITEGLDVIDTIQRREPTDPVDNIDRVTDAEVISGLENLEQGEPTTTVDLYRFRNTGFPTGTYLFVGSTERDDIQSNPNISENFALEGEGNAAFKASITETVGEDELLPFYRLRSLDTEGTYLFVSTDEYDAIFAEDSEQKDKWEQEGLNDAGEDVAEFYLYGAGAGKGVEFHRFQNTDNNTFLFAGPEETEAINNDPNLSATFTDQGVAFEAL
jgi:peptidyl-prolyl cis-trans isomerase B (cyclophilin B)